MGIFKSTKKVAGKVVDVRVDKWVSWGYLTETADRFKTILSDIAIPKKATYSETFKDAMQRLDLSEEDLQARKKEFTRLFYFFIGLAITVIIYALYSALKGHLLPSLISFCLSLYCLTQAFRFHFWLFQIKNRKLGCTFKEWLNSTVDHNIKQDLAVRTNKEEMQKPKSNQKEKE